MVLALLLFRRFCALHPQWDQNIYEVAFKLTLLISSFSMEIIEEIKRIISLKKLG